MLLSQALTGREGDNVGWLYSASILNQPKKMT